MLFFQHNASLATKSAVLGKEEGGGSGKTEFLETSVISFSVKQQCAGPKLTGMHKDRQPVCEEEGPAIVKIYE